MKPVVVVGAGYSGAMVAHGIVARGGPPVVLVEASGRFGRGAAYGTGRREHLLNVRAAGMSAFADRPDDFVHWLGTDDGAEFAPRMEYGRYLEGIVARAARDPRLDCVTASVAAAEPADGGWRVALAGGGVIDASALVLALGNFAPIAPGGVDVAGLGARWIADPWRCDPGAGLGAGDTVFLIGTGLTMIDTALTLEAGGFDGRIVAMSRRGLVPRFHEYPLVPGPPAPRPEGGVVALLATLRARTKEIGWRPAVDEWRPHVQALWRAAPDAERRRFLRHLRPWWDVHRHRIAPAIHRRIEAMRGYGRLEVHAGRLVSVTAAGGGVRAVWRGRGGEVAIDAARAINCTGPGFDLRRSGSPLVAGLLAAGTIRPDPLRLGIDTTAGGAVLVGGGEVPGLFAIGPLTRGALWEIVAVPHIRGQVADLARRLAASG